MKDMMSLKELEATREYDTDKQTIHNYIDGYYDAEFAKRKFMPITLLEIGVGKGYSIKLWDDYFNYATIVGMDVLDWAVEMYRFKPNIKIMQVDAYSDVVINKFDDATFNYIIDDGPHTLESQLIALDKWTPKLKHNGKLIIEDVDGIENAKTLESRANGNPDVWGCKIFDLRESKGRYDDIIVEVTRR